VKKRFFAGCAEQVNAIPVFTDGEPERIAAPPGVDRSQPNVLTKHRMDPVHQRSLLLRSCAVGMSVVRGFYLSAFCLRLQRQQRWRQYMTMMDSDKRLSSLLQNADRPTPVVQA